MGGKGREADHEHRFVLPPPGGEQTTGQCSCGMKREFSNLTDRWHDGGPLQGSSITRRPRTPTGGLPYDPLLENVELDPSPDNANED